MTTTLRPPLAPPLSHEKIPFVCAVDLGVDVELSNETLVAIAMALDALLPPGDLIRDGNGQLCSVQHRSVGAWEGAGRVEAIERNPR